jgi:hypothetical protein
MVAIPCLRSKICGASLRAVVLLLLFGAPRAVAQNAVVLENALPGSPPSEWEVAGAGDASIQGFATDISVDQGGTIDFKIKTDATSYRIDIYRLGWYGGDGARKVATILPSASLPQSQPAGVFDPVTRLLDCGNWAVSATWNVPPTATSGLYLAKLVRTDPEDGRASHIAFVVRDDDGESDILLQTSDTTWQAYNRYGESDPLGGYSLYEGPTGKADKVSYNRPFTTRGYPVEDWLFNAEYPMIRWLERNGYDVSYFTDVDTDRLGAEILEHRVFLSVGHDEYWSRAARENVEAARAAGVHLAFLSGNEIYWKVRWEDSIDGSGTPYRTLVCYKEGTLGENQCGTKCDPDSTVWTGLWRSGCEWPLADGCEPENALSGQISWVGSSGAIQVPALYARMPLWRSTSIAALLPGQVATLAGETLGYEWDFAQYFDSYPPGRVKLSETELGGQTHHLSLYRHQPSGALVFGAGTVQWSWGLDSVHDRGNGPEDVRMQQATVNLLADMEVTPATLQSGLVLEPLPPDPDPPVSAITFPAEGAHVASGSPVAVTGTASDPGGGTVVLVEVSTDAGATWRPADGYETWTFPWIPGIAGPATLLSRAWDAVLNPETPGGGVGVTVDPRECPCSLWSDATLPGTPAVNDPQAVELGVKFRVDTDGYVTALRFYKGPQNTGTHVGSLWTSDGTLLASVVYQAETASGWQQESLGAPIAVTANTTYVVSYHTTTGYYSFDAGYFATAWDNAPLHALADGEDGPNGVYRYGASAFPTDTYNASNYWVDVVFDTTAVDTQPPVITVRSPAPGALAVAVGANVTATFNEPVQASTISFELRDPFGAPVPATVTYDAPSRTAMLDPSADLDFAGTYEAEVSGAEDLAGNPMAAPVVWSFTTQDEPPPPPDEGPGGPILVIAGAANPFGEYVAEILRAEGLDEFAVADLAAVDAALLAQHDVVILGETPLDASQVSLLTDWVNAGGNLIAMRPDAQLAGLLGLSATRSTLSEGYLRFDTAAGPGVGLVAETIQFHGAADLYALNGAVELATLYSDATTATPHPAITLADVGANGGQAAAFTFDLARSVVATRQGNAAWAAQERDGTPPIRPDDLFFGAAAGDPQPDWVDLAKVAIPQADEQQRFFAKLVESMNEDRSPLPRFWYFPRGLKAAVVLTGDDHSGSTRDRFLQYVAADPSGCAPEDWECVRATTYLYPGNPMTDAEAAAFHAQGFEIALHVNTGCNDWTPASLEADYASQLAAFAAQYPSVPAPSTQRHHCIAWSDWASAAHVELSHGQRLDTNYYFWPPSWVLDRPGLFTGSGMPMRFADVDGTMIDVYQLATQMTDESGQSYPYTIDTLLDRALGPEGFYGAFCANMHADTPVSPGANAIVASAQARGVPIVSSKQMLTWVEARNRSSFGAIAWTGSVLAFDVAKSPSARGLEGMIPTSVGAATLASLTRDLAPVAWRAETIKGREYAFFPAEDGAYEATYAVDATPPAITALAATPSANGTALVTWTTDEPADSRVDWGTDAEALSSTQSAPALVTDHAIALTGLAANTTYYYRATSADASANAATEPPAASEPASFTTPPPPATCLTASTAADFLGGTWDAGIFVAEIGDGELTLAPTEGSDFSGTTLPPGWSTTPWTGGDATVGGGVVSVNGAMTGGATYYAAGRSMEFVATFGAVPYQHVGFAVDFDAVPDWAMFSTHNESANLWARTNPGGVNVNLGPSWIGSPHLYRIDWNAGSVDFTIDGTLVHSQPVTITNPLRPVLSDYDNDGTALLVDRLRVTPYATSGTYEAPVFDAGTPSNWGDADWTSEEPPGATLDVLVRTGDTPVPDGTWTAYVTLPGSGFPVGGSSRYLQYRVDLGTSAPARTPVLFDISFDCEAGPDVTPPLLTNLDASPGPDGTTATVTWDTNEPADSRVDYGTAPGSLPFSASAAALVTAHSLELAGLSPGTTYYYRATSADAAANAGTEPPPPSPPATFSTPYPPCAVDDLAADFALGTTGGTYVSLMDDGEVILSPALAAEFEGTTLPIGWADFPWTGGSAVVAGGSVAVDGARLREETYRTPGCSLEFAGTFAAGPGNALQHCGLAGGADLPPGEMFNTSPWAIFSTGSTGTTLSARVWDGGPFLDTTIPGSWLGAPHRYRIDWNAGSVVFSIDGAVVHTEPVAIAAAMRVGASDYDLNGSTLSIDWLRVAPYSSGGAFESRAFDAGASADWHQFSWTADEPAGTSLALETRVGDVPVPDGSWTAWAPVTSSGADLGVSARYLQYRAALATADPFVTPVLRDVAVRCGVCTDATPPAAVANLAGTARLAGNPPGDRTMIDLAWSPAEPGATVSLYRKGFGNYPEYDDPPNAGAEPAPPADPDAAIAEGWSLVATLASADSSYADLAPARDVWYHIAFVEDECGNVSPPSNRTIGAPSYHLGDVTDGGAIGQGDNVVDGLDLSALGAHYGAVEGDGQFLPVLDVGPSTGGSAHGRPLTDDRLDFEDLILYAINFEDAGLAARRSPPPPAGENALTLLLPPALPEVGGTFEARLYFAGDGSIHGIRTSLRWDGAVLEALPATGGDLLDRQAAQAMLLSPGPGAADVATLGLGAGGLQGEGWLVTIPFRVLAAGSPQLGLASVAARDAANHDVTLRTDVATGTEVVLGPPRVTALHAGSPNPFAHTTRLAFDLAQRGRVSLRIYSVDGRLVRTLVREDLEPGRYARVWDGRDEGGRRVASNVYFYRMEAPGFQRTRKMLMLR